MDYLEESRKKMEEARKLSELEFFKRFEETIKYMENATSISNVVYSLHAFSELNEIFEIFNRIGGITDKDRHIRLIDEATRVTTSTTRRFGLY